MTTRPEENAAPHIGALYERSRAARLEALAADEALLEAVRAFRAAHPAPAGSYWDERHGRMVLRPAPDRCTYAQDECSEGCGAEAVGADDKGNAWCEEHRQGER